MKRVISCCNQYFRENPDFPYKSLCGDYPTASGFALWFAALLLKEQKATSLDEKDKIPLTKYSHS